MALINGIYVHVINEDVSRSVKLSSHSVESGIEITDTVKPEPTELNISGKIVSYSGYSQTKQPVESNTITAWISLVKRNYSAFEHMSFERLNDELVAFSAGVQWVNTGEVQYLNGDGIPIDISNGVGEVYEVRFEVKMPYGGTVRVHNAYRDICAFNIINASNTGYEIRDYSADDAVSEVVLSNTYNGQTGRVRSEFTNSVTSNAGAPAPSVNRSAAWVIAQLTRMHETGSLITYEGRNQLANYQIKDFSSSHSHTNAGGAEFSMLIRQCRTAVNSYNASADTAEYVDDAISNGSVQQISKGDNSEVWYPVQVGDSIAALINGEYAGLNRGEIDGQSYSVYEWIMKMNPDAFSVEGDITSLRAYTDILLGMR